MPSREKLTEFTAWCQKHISGDEKGHAQIFLSDRARVEYLFQLYEQLTAPLLANGQTKRAKASHVTTTQHSYE